jgi:hypothetical protein
MTTPHQGDQAEPFFITEEIEADMRAAGYVFEPPPHVCTSRLADVLVGMTDAELAAWSGELADRERERRKFIR